MIGRLKDLTINMDQSQNITLTVTSDFREMFDKLKDSDVNIEIKKASKRRSLDANNYLWYLCGEIAKASSRFSDDGKDDVYKEAIRAKGEWQAVPIREDAIETFVRKWSQRGTGWFAEVIDEYTGPTYDAEMYMGDNVLKYYLVHIYFGSSTYDSASMSRVIDYAVNMANDLGIPTLTPAELEHSLSVWQTRFEKHEKT